jgi:hypothetical protein
VPGLDSLWDGVHTLLRIPAGAALAGAVFGGDQVAWTTVAALLGGTLAATSHVAKATTRAAVNTSPEPFSNIALSLAGDALVPAMLWLAVSHPLWFGAALLLFLVASVALTLVLLKFLQSLLRSLRRRLGGQPASV